MTPLRAAPAPLVTDDGVVVFDFERRTYLALSHDGTYWHVVRPLRAHDQAVREGTRAAGELVCSCIGGQTHGTCYRLTQAEALEAAVADEARWGLPVVVVERAADEAARQLEARVPA